jgi:predicted membrane protein
LHSAQTIVCFERLENWQYSAVVVEMQHSEAVEGLVREVGVLGVVILPVSKVFVGSMMFQQQWIMLFRQW